MPPLERFTVICGILITIAVFRKLFPVTGSPLTQAQRKNLHAEYRSWYFFYTFTSLLATVCLGYLFYQILKAASHSANRPGSGDRFFLTLDPLFLVFPASCSALLAGLAVNAAFFRLILGSRYAELIAYSDQRAGFSGRKVLVYFGAPFFTFLALVGALGLDYHARVTDTAFVTNDFWSLGSVAHSYDQVVSIKHVKRFKAPTGKIVDSPHYVIQFGDGYQWNSRKVLYTVVPREQQADKNKVEAAMIAFIASHAHRKIETVDLLN
jgi:hypothetical protein